MPGRLIAKVCLVACVLVAGWNSVPPVRTASSIERAQTSQYLTQGAPPPGFEQSVAYPHIDDKLSDQPSWHYTAALSFEGVFSGTTDKATGAINADIYSSE